MRHLAEHREFFAAVLASPERAKVRERFTRRLAELLVRSMDAAPSHPNPVELQVAAVYTAAGFTAAASDWLAGAFDLDEAELTRIVVAMTPEWLRNPEVRAP
ncbi:TetR-like C-terminal domain-containing protein [Agrococcus citreus]